MFIQTIQGHVADPEELKRSLDQWMSDLSPGADGWLGTTTGVTADGTSFALVRFASQDAARRNSDRPEQHQWWMETSKLFSGDVTFHDCTDVDEILGGGSDQAGFVQIIQGRTRDPDRTREIGRRMEPAMKQHRPEAMGGLVAWHGDGGYTMAIYFSSERDARQGERKEPPPEIVELMEEERSLHLQDETYLDLTDPWLYSPA